MERFAILRFGDAEASTVVEHNKIINDKQSVWWGWWKKQTETFPSDFLRYLREEARRKPIQVGLVKRKEEEELYFAVCNEVSFEDDASRIGSPDPILTPQYYRDEKCPAWFRFTQIHIVQRGRFLREFGFVPISDPTLYEVLWDEKEKFDIRPKPDWSMEIIEAPGDAILHLSDLHFGADHGFPLVHGANGVGLESRPLVEIIADRLLRSLKVKIGVVVVSGDLITRGDTNAYPHAKAFLEDLLPRLELTSRHCVMVPGNHDLWTIGVDHPTRDYRHELPYRDFANGFFGIRLQELERVRRYRTPGGFDLYSLNSTQPASEATSFVSMAMFQNIATQNF